uniref:polyamine-modulated factor 1-binding protein 1 n=1 Tax=Euleptes europaea TaxID=460621 RepID=UPI002541C768|nr:polyamine-modulated factor 1-binding protein 1 [Euleptes europaea]
MPYGELFKGAGVAVYQPTGGRLAEAEAEVWLEGLGGKRSIQAPNSLSFALPPLGDAALLTGRGALPPPRPSVCLRGPGGQAAGKKRTVEPALGPPPSLLAQWSPCSQQKRRPCKVLGQEEPRSAPVGAVLTQEEEEGGGLRGEDQPLQDTLGRSLRERRMVEQTRVIHPLQHKKEASLLQSRAQAALLEQLQGQAKLEPLQGHRRHLQRELDVPTGSHQDTLRLLQGREWPAEEHSLDPDLLLHQCQILQDQLSYYEEVTQRQELALSQRQEEDRHRQEQLAQAEHSVSVLKSSLDLYKKKYQASLGRAGELESHVQRLAEELAGQAKEGDEAALKLQEDTLARLLQELLGTQGRHLTSQCEEIIQELQTQLAASHTKLLDQKEAIADLQRDLAAYKAAHTYSNSSYESQVLHADSLRQKLLQVEGESSEHQRRAEEYQALVQDLKRELARVAEQKHNTTQDVAHLELDIQSLRLEAAAKWERQQLEAEERQQRVQQLEAELQQSRQCCAQQEQAIQKRDEVLRKSQLEIVHARSTLQEKGREVALQRAGAQQLETSLQRAQEELQQSQRECAALRTEAQALQQRLQESWEQEQRAAQELAQQKELVLLTQSSLRHTQEELSEREAEVLHHRQAGRQMEAELRGLTDRVAAAEAELEQKRGLLEDRTEELRQSKQRHQAAAEEAKRHRQMAAQLELELESSRAGLQGLRQQMQTQGSTLEVLRAEVSQQKHQEEDLQKQLLRAKEQASGLAQERKALHKQLQSSERKEQQRKGHSLQSVLTEREAENQVLREQLKQHATQLEAARGDCARLQLQLHQQAAEALQQEAALSQLHSELQAAQEKEQQSSHFLAAAQDLAQDLQRQLASIQASQRAALEQLEERGREVSHLQADLQLSRHKEAHLKEELAAHQEQTQQLRSQCQALQRQREEETCSSEEQLGELGRRVQHWKEEHRAAERALADRDEELVVLRVELATLEEKQHAAAEEREELQAEALLSQQKFVISNREVEGLQTALEGARADTHCLRQESERMVAHVTQWAQEQKQVKERLGHKIRDQIKQIAQLTGERDHFQGLTERLQQENKRLKNEADEWRIEQERLKLWGSRRGGPVYHHKCRLPSAICHLSDRGQRVASSVPTPEREQGPRLKVGPALGPCLQSATAGERTDWQPPIHMPGPAATIM